MPNGSAVEFRFAIVTPQVRQKRAAVLASSGGAC